MGCTQHPLPSPLRGLQWGKQARKNRGACGRDLPESLQPDCPKGMSLLHGCKDPFLPFPQGSHLAEDFFRVPCCLVPGPWLGSMGRENFARLCSSLSGSPCAPGKGGSSSEQPRGECVLVGLWSPSVGQGPTWTAGTRSRMSSELVTFCSLLVPGGESLGHRSAEHNEPKPGEQMMTQA